MTTEIPLPKESKLAIAAREFGRATNNLRTIQCGKCVEEPRCEIAGLCTQAVKIVDLESVRYIGALEAHNKKQEEIPYRDIQQFQYDTRVCIKQISNMNKGDSGIWGFVQRLYTRIKLADELKTSRA